METSRIRSKQNIRPQKIWSGLSTLRVLNITNQFFFLKKKLLTSPPSYIQGCVLSLLNSSISLCHQNTKLKQRALLWIAGATHITMDWLVPNTNCTCLSFKFLPNYFKEYPTLHNYLKRVI